MERGLGSLEGRRRLAGEALPGDIESSDAYVRPHAEISASLSALVVTQKFADQIASENV